MNITQEEKVKIISNYMDNHQTISYARAEIELQELGVIE